MDLINMNKLDPMENKLKLNSILMIYLVQEEKMDIGLFYKNGQPVL